MPMNPLHRFAVLLALLSAAFVSPAFAADEPAPLRVMSFNVRLPTDADGADRWQARRDLLVDTVREQHPDVIGTQELFAVQGEYLVQHLPGYAWFGRGRSGKPDNAGDEHMGVFYRRDALRVIESGDFWLSDTPEVAGSISWGNLYPRLVTWALFERIADGRRFYFFNTHLPYREQDEAARERGVALLQRRIAALPADAPVVVTGDFNTTPDSPAHALITGQLADAWDSAARRDGPAATFHGFTGKADKRIDWILLRGLRADAIRTVTRQRDGHYPSDHFPLLAELGWPARP